MPISDSQIETLKLIGTFGFGGLAGQVLGEYFRRRRARIQTVTLIDRVNRVVTPGARGITLARVLSNEGERHLEEIADLREYQLTLRNTSSVHLQNADIQFEFPVEDVQSWASRPARSQTALIPVEAIATEPWKKAFRWRIPHLPAGDSVEFTFQAVAPASDKYLAALYNTERVVIERTSTEPRTSVRQLVDWIPPVLSVLIVLAVLLETALSYRAYKDWSPRAQPDPQQMDRMLAQMKEESERRSRESGRAQEHVSGSGCDLLVESSFGPYGSFEGAWRSTQDILNVGGGRCHVSLPDVFTRRWLDPGTRASSERVVTRRPAPLRTKLTFSSGAEKPTESDIKIFVSPPDAQPGPR